MGPVKPDMILTIRDSVVAMTSQSFGDVTAGHVFCDIRVQVEASDPTNTWAVQLTSL